MTVLWLKSGFGLKLALGALGVLLGLGGITVGARFHASHPAQNIKFITAAQILDIEGDTYTVRLGTGKVVTAKISSSVTIVKVGRTLKLSDLRVGDYLIVQGTRTLSGNYTIKRIRVLNIRLKPAAQGP